MGKYWNEIYILYTDGMDTPTALIQTVNTTYTTTKYMFIVVYKYYGVVYFAYCLTVINNTANIFVRKT